MKYPYFLLCGNARVAPAVRLDGQAHLIILDDEMAEKALSLMGDSEGINEWFSGIIAASGRKWAVGAYLENREKILSCYPQMASEQRYFHLGVDICAPAGTPVYAPFDGVVFDSGYEEGEGNYGGYVILRHELQGCEPFYLLFGHMSLASLPDKGKALRAGDEVAKFGDLHENGGWNHHTHIQVITETGRDAGFFFRGYCSLSDLPVIDSLCPSPVPLLAAGAVRFYS